MVTKTGRRMTLAEFLALPEEKPYPELTDGEVCQKPMGKEPHGRAQWTLQRALDRHPATEHGRIRAELTLPIAGSGGANARVPDVSYYLPGCKPISEPFDPDHGTVAVHDGEHAWLAHAGDHVTLECLAGFDFAVQDLFSD